MLMTTLYLVRHGETKDNAAMTLQGQRQGELTPVGRTQIEELAVSLAGIRFDAIVSSDLRRAYDSALILGSHLNLSVQTTTLLRERDWGDFTGCCVPDIEGLPLPENVESISAMENRAKALLDWIRTYYSGKVVLAVGHGIINMAIEAVLAGKPTCDIPKMSNAEYRILTL